MSYEAYSYDDSGNRLTKVRISSAPADDKTVETQWDHRNRLTGIVTKNNSGVVTKAVDYEYDVFNRRVSKSIDTDGAGPGATEVTRFVYDGGDILAVTDASGDITHRMLHGPAVDQILAIEEDATGEVLWGLTDHLGSIRDIVDNDGNVENHIVYDAFGNVVSETDAAIAFLYGFTGRERDEESGLNYHRARYYDTATGRWLSNDPIGFAAGDTNIQRYVGNNPVNYVDPSGLVGEPIEVSISIDVDSGGMWSPPPQQGRTWGQWLLGTGGDWLDRNYGGGQYGDPDITGRILHASSDLSTLLPGGGEVRDVADIVIGIDAAGNRLTPVERGATVAMLAIPVVPTRWVRGPAIDIVDGVVDRTADAIEARRAAQLDMDYEDALLDAHDAEFYQNVGGDTLRPGPYTVESIPGHRGRPTSDEQRQVNELMERHGCHTCGTNDPGTTSGNAVADHFPPQQLGYPREFLPHCIDCARRQGGQVLQEILRRGS
ncbi:RHS repeat-associated core domain-containing protein [Pirellulaceae bacterium SH501]